MDSAFTFGHVRQLDRVLGETLTRAWRAGAGPGSGRLVVDVDSFVGEVPSCWTDRRLGAFRPGHPSKQTASVTESPATHPSARPATQPGNAPKLTLAEAAELLERNRAGESQRALAAEVGCARSYMHTIL